MSFYHALMNHYLALTPELLIIGTVLLPIFAAMFAKAATDHPNIREGMTLFIACFTFLNILRIVSLFIENIPLSSVVAQIAAGMEIRFDIEPLGLIFALIASFLWIVSTLYSIGYMRGNHEQNQTRFYMSFSLAISGVLGIAFAGNLFTLFLFYEMVTICTYPLVTHHQTIEARAAGRTYLGILLGSSICFLLPAIVWVWSTTGTVNFTPGGIVRDHFDGFFFGVITFLFIYGIAKAALMPLHRWLPAAMVAPTPVSALLHAVAVVKAGVFSIVKIVIYILGVDYMKEQVAGSLLSGGWIIYAAGTTIILASVVALKQDNLKRLLAYSTVSQLSYVVLAAAILAPKAIIAASFHIVAHAFSKITLFFAAGAIYTASKKKNVSQLDGIARAMPWTMTAFAIGALSMIGLPPTVGFLSKYYLLMGAFTAHSWFAIIVIIASTVLNCAYFLPILYRAFFKAPSPDAPLKHKEAPVLMVLALVITASITLILFFKPGIFLDFSMTLAKIR